MANDKRLSQWLPIYVDDLLFSPDVETMSCEERGAYLWLLMRQWKMEGGLPNDKRVLAQYTNLDLKRFNVVWKRLASKFDLNANGRLVNRRLEAVRSEQLARANDKSEKSKAAINKRWEAEKLRQQEAYVRNTEVIAGEDRIGEEKIPTYTTPTNGGGSVKPWELDSKPDDPPQADVVEFMEGYRKSFESITKGKLPLVWSWNDTVAAKEVLKTWPMSEIAKDGRPRVLHMVDFFLMNPAHGTLLRNIKAFKANAPTYDGKMRERGL